MDIVIVYMLDDVITSSLHVYVQAFSELQIKMIENNQRVRIAESQVAALHREITKSQLTDEELLKLPSGTKTYESVGRM